MNNKEEAEAAWHNKARQHVRSYNGYNAGISDFKAALIQAVEKDRDEYKSIRDGWKPQTIQFETYDLAVRIHDKFLSRINETKPL